MKIYGNEYGFYFSINASIEIAEICPEKNIENLPKLISESSYPQQVKILAKMLHEMSKAHEMKQMFEQEGYERHVLTEDMVLSLAPGDVSVLFDEAFRVMNADSSTTVTGVEDPKVKKNPNLKK